MINGTTLAITVVDDIFSADDCQEAIRYFERTPSVDHRFRETPQLDFLPIVDFKSGKPRDEVTGGLVKKLFKHLGDSVRIQRAHIESRGHSSGLPWHFDEANPVVVFTSVTYLNEDYTGGETVIRPTGEESDKYDTVIKPKVGRTVFFNGTQHWHMVRPIYGVERFTLPVWYRLMPEDFPDSLKWWHMESFSPGTG